MAKKPKDDDRRAMIEKMRAEQQRKEKLRSSAILGVCVLAVLALLGLAVVKYVQDEDTPAVDVSAIGATRAGAACDPIKTEKPTGSSVSGAEGSHVEIGTKVDYPQSPPAFGQHWPNFILTDEYRNFYSAADRPEVERLVHSLEHGHTLIWYDDTIKEGSQEFTDLQDIAKEYDGTSTYVNVVPWLPADGDAFPEGKHVVLTHWAGEGEDQEGIWEYCGKASGTVINDFVEKYPNTDSPEAGAQ